MRLAVEGELGQSLGYSEHLREPAAFHRRLANLFAVGFGVEPVQRAPFAAELNAWPLESVHLAEVRFSAHRTHRIPLPNRGSREYFLINWQIEGRVYVTQDGREAEVAPGDLYIINTNHDFTLETEALVARSIFIPAERFRAIYPEVDCCTAVSLGTRMPVGRIVASSLSSLFEEAAALDPACGESIGDVISHLLSMALGSRRTQVSEMSSRLTSYQLERVKGFARQHLRDPNLDCQMIASSLQLSQRLIYDLFAKEPLTLMRWIRAERLRRCHRELSLPALSGRSVSEIAFSWGFCDLAHFSRAFSSQYGLSPRLYRRRACESAPPA